MDRERGDGMQDAQRVRSAILWGPDETKTPVSWLAIFILKGARGTSTVLHMCASHALVYCERHVPNRKHFWLV
jgi:hypothetical protein